VIPNVCALEIIHLSYLTPPHRKTALDIACGPGEFTLDLVERLKFNEATGLDISGPMIAAANQGAADRRLSDRVRFRVGNANDLSAITTDSFDLVCLNHAAHHLSDLDAVIRVFSSMDRIAKPSGMVFIMDLARLKTRALTERYVESVSADYPSLGLELLKDEFRHSMFAAWTPRELRQAIPDSCKRRWFHLVPRGLPVMQMIVGVADSLYAGAGLPWGAGNHPVPKVMRAEWQLLRWLLRLGVHRVS
jgi:SAM-dependent methyltransferase